MLDYLVVKHKEQSMACSTLYWCFVAALPLVAKGSVEPPAFVSFVYLKYRNRLVTSIQFGRSTVRIVGSALFSFSLSSSVASSPNALPMPSVNVIPRPAQAIMPTPMYSRVHGGSEVYFLYTSIQDISTKPTVYEW